MAQETITVLKIDGDSAIKTLKDLRSSISELNKQLSGLDIGSEKYNNTLTQLTLSKKLLRDAVNGNVSAFSEEAKSVRAVTSAEEVLHDTTELSSRSYAKLSAQLKVVNAERRNLSRSTEAERKLFARLSEQSKAINDELKAMDAAVGRYSRNVGNYASAFNGLNVAVGQVMRELPSLGMNANTFFLAISNNIPMVVDQIQMLRAQNKALIADGKEGFSVTRQFLKSLVSFNSLMSIGITLLTLYGGKIVEWIGSLFKGKEAVDDLSGAMERMNKAAEFDDAGETIATFQSLARAYIAAGDSAADKQKFIEDYKDEIEKTGIAINDINDADNAFITNSDKFIEAMRLRAVAAAGMEKASEQYAKALEEQTKNADRIAEAEAAQAKALEEYQKAKEKYAGVEGAERYIQAAENAYKGMTEALGKLTGQAFIDAGNAYIEAAGKLKEQADNILDDAGIVIGKTGGGLENAVKDIEVKRVNLRIREVKPELDIDYDEFYDDLQDEIDGLFDPEITRLKNQLTVALDIVNSETDKRIEDANNGDGGRIEREDAIYQAERDSYEKRIALYTGFADELEKLGMDGLSEALGLREKASELMSEMNDLDEENTKNSEKRKWELRTKYASLSLEATADMLNSLADIYEQNSKGDEASVRRVKNLRIASATMDTIAGATSAYMNTMKSFDGVFAFPATLTLAILNAATVFAAGMANVAKIRNTDVSGNSAPSASSSSIGATVSAPSIPTEVPQTRTLTSASEERRLNERGKDQRVYLVWSDVEAAGRKARIRETETSF